MSNRAKRKRPQNALGLWGVLALFWWFIYRRTQDSSGRSSRYGAFHWLGPCLSLHHSLDGATGVFRLPRDSAGAVADTRFMSRSSSHATVQAHATPLTGPSRPRFGLRAHALPLAQGPAPACPSTPPFTTLLYLLPQTCLAPYPLGHVAIISSPPILPPILILAASPFSWLGPSTGLHHSLDGAIGEFGLPRDGAGAVAEHPALVGRAGEPRPAELAVKRGGAIEHYAHIHHVRHIRA